jgi:hypothetical protein
MRAFTPAETRPQPRDFRRNPLTCVVLAVVLSATFWAGLIWAAQRFYG